MYATLATYTSRDGPMEIALATLGIQQNVGSWQERLSFALDI